MRHKLVAVVALIAAGCSSPNASPTSVSVPKTPPTVSEPAPAPPPPVPEKTPARPQTDTWKPLRPETRGYGPQKKVTFTAEDQSRIIRQRFGEGPYPAYQRHPDPPQLSMPDAKTLQGTVTAEEAGKMVLSAKQKGFTVTYRLQGSFEMKPGTALFGIIGSGQVTSRPEGDYYINTDNLFMVKQGEQVWTINKAANLVGPFPADNVDADLGKTAVALLPIDELGLLNVLYWSWGGGRKIVAPDLEEWYQGGVKQSTISLLSSDLFSCYYYKLTVKKTAEGYLPVSLDIRFWDARNLGLHAEWNFDTPTPFPKVR